jgi:hypothetical protein
MFRGKRVAENAAIIYNLFGTDETVHKDSSREETVWKTELSLNKGFFNSRKTLRK